MPKTKPKTELQLKKETEAYRRGYDAGMNGANTHNCHFSIFAKSENTKEWERGNNDGSYDRELIIQKHKKSVK